MTTQNKTQVIESILKLFDYATFTYSDSNNMNPATRTGLTTKPHTNKDKATQALNQLISDITTKTEKAFGGCKICYGKGYHTKRVGTSSRYGNVTHDTIGYCKCDRGKQLATQVSDITTEARIDEARLFKLNIIPEQRTPDEINKLINNRIKELKAQPPNKNVKEWSDGY